ncbi:hypothetical protein RYA05_04525 [Pseudomonas syringae pv. actinidiae]|nr:hypothetical protein [Pseudomonas syringae pv. actinidiae]
MPTIKTSLGDSWVLDQDFAKSEHSGSVYRISEDMERLLNGAQDANPIKRDRMATRLRDIDSGPLTPDGQSFVIADRTLGGVWGHPVRFDNPRFDWNERARTEGTLLLLVENTGVGIQTHIGDPKLNEVEPGQGDDVFNVMIWDDEDKEYCIAYQASSFDHAQDYALKGDLNKKLRAQPPLPWLSYEQANIFELPSAEKIGKPGMYVEVQLKSVVEDGFRNQYCDIHLMDKFGRCVAASELGIDGLFDIRDNPKDLKEFIEQYPFKDEKGVLHNFKHSEVFEPDSEEELRDVFNQLAPGRFVKLQTPDAEYQMLVSYTLVDTYRANNTNKRLHTGPGAPSEEVLRASGALRVVIGSERAYSVVIKHAEGAMTRTLSNVILRHEALFKLSLDEDSVVEMIENARLRPISFADNIKSGDAPCYHQLLGACLQGRVFDIEYAHSRNEKVEDILKQMEAARNKTSELSMSM